VDQGERHLILASETAMGFFYVIDSQQRKNLFPRTRLRKVKGPLERFEKMRAEFLLRGRTLHRTLEGKSGCAQARPAANELDVALLTIRKKTQPFSTSQGPTRNSATVFSNGTAGGTKRGHGLPNGQAAVTSRNDDAAPVHRRACAAIDPNTGKMKWEWKHPSPTWGWGAFYGRRAGPSRVDAEGNFNRGLEGRFGQGALALPVRCVGVCIRRRCLSRSTGKQYVACCSGGRRLFTFALPWTGGAF